MQILYEDDHLLAVNKPAGLSAESGLAGHPSAERGALGYCRSKQPDKPAPYMLAVHRLDRATSGVLLLAKSKAALTALMAQFERKQVEKVYQAEVSGLPPAESGVLRHFLARTPDGKSALVSDREIPDSKPVELRYRVLEKTADGARLEIFPATGRFHQIRAQLAFAGFPVTGDTRYGGPPWREHAVKLHACRLSVRHPKSGAALVLEASAPDEW